MKYLLALSIFVFSFSASATRFDVVADVGEVRHFETTNAISTPMRTHSWFTLINSSQSLTNCPKSSGNPIITIPAGNDSAIAILISAKMANKKILVTLDDAVKFPSTEGCKLQYLTLSQ